MRDHLHRLSTLAVPLSLIFSMAINADAYSLRPGVRFLSNE
jgi:hypothetical protein